MARQEIDHVAEWAATKRTELRELAAPCGHHHDLKTHHGYRFGPVEADGKRQLIPPDEAGASATRVLAPGPARTHRRRCAQTHDRLWVRTHPRPPGPGRSAMPRASPSGLGPSPGPGRPTPASAPCSTPAEPAAGGPSETGLVPAEGSCRVPSARARLGVSARLG